MDVCALFKRRGPMQSFPKRLPASIGAVAAQEDDTMRLQRLGELFNLAGANGDNRHLLQVKLPFEVARHEHIRVEARGNSVSWMGVDERLRSTERIREAVENGIAGRRRSFV